MDSKVTTDSEKMRNAIVSIVQKALTSPLSEDVDFIYSKTEILNFLKSDIDEFIKDFILFEKRY